MTIYVEFEMGAAERRLLETAAAGHELFVADAAQAEVSAAALRRAEVVFGAVACEALSRARQLRWIQFPSVGVDAYRGFDWSSFAHPVVCTNLRGVFDEPMAQTVLAAILGHYRGLGRLQRLQTACDWQKLQVRPQTRVLQGAQVLLLGNGSMSRRVRELLAAFGCRFTTYARTSGDIQSVEALEEALAGADLVVAALPETPATVGLLDARRIARLKAGALFVNVGRGSLVDEAALLRALAENRIGGAVLDVTREEPLPPDSPLWTAANVVLTQHTSAGSDREAADVVGLFADNLARFLSGRPLRNVVDWSRGY